MKRRYERREGRFFQTPISHTFREILDIFLETCSNNVAGNVTGNVTKTSAPIMALKKTTATIQDVAQGAGVSVSTVSRVLNEKVDVAEETRQKVLAVIDELEYASDLAARSMRSQKSDLIGLVVPDIGFPYSIEIMKGINRAIAHSEFDLLVYTTGDVQKKGAASHEQRYVSLLNNSITDGVIIVASAAAKFITNAPIIAVDPHNIDPDYPSVQGTNYQGSLDAMEYLISLGHRKIAFICGRPEIGSSGRREKGYRDSMARAGIEIEEAYVVSGDFTKDTGLKRAKELLSLENPPTAIFASNDQSALGVIQAAEEMGINIPDELSVLGFDNILEAEYLGLTTVDQNLSEMGFVATNMLIKMVGNELVDVKTYKMPTKLIVRKTCKEIST